MRTSFILSAVVAIFSVFAAASPVAAPAPELIVRDTTSDAITGHLTSCKTELDTCHKKWTSTCSGSCSSNDIISWQKECAVIIVKWTGTIKGTIPSGWKCPTSVISIIVKLVVEIIIAINICLTFLLGKCGLLGGILSLVIILVASLLVELKIAINGLLVVLALVIDGLLSLVVTLLVSLLGGATCFCCSLFGLIL
ncbi:uncharacterized protein H6S33_006692 [Morchella sextelata]|uniref:uncharacterized protein n=1 Tax=Morchella sextelata TaxID=1174677 RepID=UPI001D050873|nr:uncharacterized protein H6S33_006692 [Morchella sextelata]KAH0604315.1 hypothetical protein H6S33_006692 [Morchella sextelata]